MDEGTETPELASESQLPTMAEMDEKIKASVTPNTVVEMPSQHRRKKGTRGGKRSRGAIRHHPDEEIRATEFSVPKDIAPEPLPLPPPPQFTAGDIEAIIRLPIDMIFRRMDKEPLTDHESAILSASAAKLANKYAESFGAYADEIAFTVCLGSILLPRFFLQPAAAAVPKPPPVAPADNTVARGKTTVTESAIVEPVDLSGTPENG